MKTKVILATRNPSKAEQIKGIFADSSVEIVSLAETNIQGEGIENGTTLEENATKKARFVHDLLAEKQWVMADDTGLFILALDGRPGIKAARWAGEEATTKEITQYTLDQLAGVDDRSATFETVVSLLSPDGERFVFSGEVHGKLLDEPRVPAQPKMPYSPLFVPDGYYKVWAEMTVDEENTISHRGKAFRKVLEFFKKQ